MWLRTAGILLLGGLSVLFSHRDSTPVFLHEPLRDVGLALIIAAVVTVVYEAYARERFAAETLNDLLAKVVGDIVDSEVWREMREQILEKTAVRRLATLKMRVMRRADLPSGQLLVAATIEYRLASLRSYAHKVRILHFLDAYMANPTLGLPRFTHVTIGAKVLPLAANTTEIKEEVTIGGRGDRDIPVLIEREELVYIPGNYVFIMSELTQLESVFLLDVPSDVRVKVNWTFGEADMNTTDAVRPVRFFLPGQCLEFRFTAA